MAQKFNAGDKVRYVGSVCHGMPQGTLGVLTKVFDTSLYLWPYYVKWEGIKGCSEGALLGDEDVSGLSPMSSREIELVKE